MKYAIKFATPQSLRRYGELAEEAGAWVKPTSRIYVFDTAEKAEEECKEMNLLWDGQWVHEVYEIEDDE